MTIIRSISGIRGTIGGFSGEGLTPADIVMFTAAFARLIRENSKSKKLSIVIGRDARVSGPMVSYLVTGTLMGCGADVIDLGPSTTPTVEMAVTRLHADGGIILTASHNPFEWNALKLLDVAGEFISAAQGERLLQLTGDTSVPFATAHEIGKYRFMEDQLQEHIRDILALPVVDREAILRARFSVAVDAVNSTGGIAIPMLLKALGIETVHGINMVPDGHFAHDPEPLPENLEAIRKTVSEHRADVGFVVDPDVDRLAIVMENGDLFGEEYTLVAVADYILQLQPGNTVSNLSSTRALRDVTDQYGGQYFASAVGEVNVVEKMKRVGAVIGGEGNGGVIYPPLHYGRDALVGIALFLTWLARSGKSCSDLRKSYPDYFISKNKIRTAPGIKPDKIIRELTAKYSDHPQNTEDGLRIDFAEEWVHMRKSNTEPIIRIYAESRSMENARRLAGTFMEEISRRNC